MVITKETPNETFGNLQILVLASDLGGCRTYRIRNPIWELKRFNVDTLELTYIPSRPGVEEIITTMINMVKNFDVVIVQRLYLYPMCRLIKDACEFVGVPCIFETDDDYLNLPPDNPAYLSVIHPNILSQLVDEKFQIRPGVSAQDILNARAQALYEYKQIIAMMDAVTVSTEELRQTLLPYNKNIKVFENCVLSVYPWRTWESEESMTKNGVITPTNNHGMVSVPAFRIAPDNKSLIGRTRIGYTTSPSHRGKDWATISEYWERLIKKHAKDWWFVYIGADPGELGNFTGDRANNLPPRDPWIRQHLNTCVTNKLPWRVAPIAPAEYDLYQYHLRNLDVGIAPLHMEGPFNQSKSPIKLLEYSMFGVPGVAPDYITYNRIFEHGKTALLYQNGRQFMEYVELLANDPKLRLEIGVNAMNMTKEKYLQKDQAFERFKFLKDIADGSYKLKIFHPNKEVA